MGRKSRFVGIGAMLAAGGLAALPAWADEAESAPPAGPYLAASAPSALPGLHLRARAGALFAAQVRGLELRVVELPPQQQGFGPPRRAHHALSFRNEAPRRWLQSIGVDVTECTTRVRFPSRFAPSSGGGVAAEVAAQVHFNCRF